MPPHDKHSRAYSFAAPKAYYAKDELAHQSQGVPSASPEDGYARFRNSASDIEKSYGLEFLRRKKIIRPFQYTTEVTPIQLAANGQTTEIIEIRKEADFQVEKISAVVDLFEQGRPAGVTAQGVRGDDFTMRMVLTRKENALMNQPIHSNLCTGSGVFPLVLPDAAWLAQASTLRIELTNRRAFPIDIHLTLTGSNFYFREFEQLVNVNDFTRLSRAQQEFFMASKKKYIEAYWYTLDQESITLQGAGNPGDADSDIIRIRQEAGFEAFYLMAFSDGPFRYRMRETNTGRFLSNGFIHSAVGTGDGERPFIFPESLWLDNNSLVDVEFENLDDDANEIFFTLLGRNWYDTPSMNLTAGPDFWFQKYTSIPGQR